jgi:hypothetical protein
MISTFECDSSGDCELAQTASPSIAHDTNITVFVLDVELRDNPLRASSQIM